MDNREPQRSQASQGTTTTSFGVVTRDESLTVDEMARGPRSVMAPTMPAGSTISEVTVETPDEGSSNDSSSSDEDEEANDKEGDEKGSRKRDLLVPSIMSSQDMASTMDPSQYEEQLEAIMRGPARTGPRRSILDEIPSSSDTEHSDSEKEIPASEEDEDADARAFRRFSKKSNRNRSLSPDASVGIDGEDIDNSVHIFMDGPQELPHADPVGISLDNCHTALKSYDYSPLVSPPSWTQALRV